MRKKVKKYNQLIAVNLIPKMKEIQQNPPPIIGFTITRLQYLISLILTHKQDNHPGSYSLLNMGYLKNIIPRSDEYLNFLKDQNIIEWKNYSAGRNSRIYRLVNEGRTEYRTITDMRLVNRIETNRRNIQRQNSKKYPALNEYIHKVGINYNAALNTIESEYQKERNEGRRTFSLAEIEKIQSDEIFIKVNKTNGRLDSNYTRLPAELIQHLTIDGKHLIEIDIRNSQPFFAATIINPTPEIEALMTSFLGHSLTMFVKSLQIAECKDVKLYASLVTKGEFYDPFLMEKFKENGIEFKDRDDLKTQMFIVFFGKVNADKYNPAARLFKSLFPNILRMFDAIKQDQHNQLSIFLQRIESYTILQRVAKKILSELPGLPFLTRHDSLLPSGIMITDNVEKVKNIMLSVIKEVTGLTPQVRIKNGKEKTKKKLKLSNLIYSINFFYFLYSLSLCIPNSCN
jgi:hypothetical protein